LLCESSHRQRKSCGGCEGCPGHDKNLRIVVGGGKA
jgi:hypothetical protein